MVCLHWYFLCHSIAKTQIIFHDILHLLNCDIYIYLLLYLLLNRLSFYNCNTIQKHILDYILDFFLDQFVVFFFDL